MYTYVWSIRLVHGLCALQRVTMFVSPAESYDVCERCREKIFERPVESKCLWALQRVNVCEPCRE